MHNLYILPCKSWKTRGLKRFHGRGIWFKFDPLTPAFIPLLIRSRKTIVPIY